MKCYYSIIYIEYSQPSLLDFVALLREMLIWFAEPQQNVLPYFLAVYEGQLCGMQYVYLFWFIVYFYLLCLFCHMLHVP